MRQYKYRNVKTALDISRKLLEENGVDWERCFFCKTSRNTPSGFVSSYLINIHHIDIDHKNRTPKNLLPLCKNCHAKLHNRIYPQLFGTKNTKLIREYLATIKKIYYGRKSRRENKIS